MVKTVKIVAFIKALRTGRTCPCLMLCADQEGSQIEAVVKLASGGQSTRTGLICELMAALLARDLDLPVPAPFIVDIDPDFYQCVTESDLAGRFRGSAGENFASKFLGPGYVTWPQGRSISGSLVQDAADIFAFDLIIQNPDRRKGKPNLLCKGDELAIFDHEMAFSFLYAIRPDEYPWQGKGIDYAKDHVFYGGLKGCTLQFDRMQGALEAIDDRRLEMYIKTVPGSWQNEGSNATNRIKEYLMMARDNSKKLFGKIREVLI
jgi:hypothetical protein